MADECRKRKAWSWRAFISTSTLILMILVGLSGLQMHIYGGGAALGLTHGEMKHLHLQLSWFLAFFAGYHLVLNWKPLVSYVVRRGSGPKLRVEALVAVVVAVVVCWVSVAHALTSLHVSTDSRK